MSKGKDNPGVIKIAAGVMLARLIGVTLHGLRRLAWRWRRVLTPLWVGLGLWFFAVLYRWVWPTWWPVVLVVPAAGTALAVLGPRLGDRMRDFVMRLVPEGLDRGKDGVLDRVPERAYLAGLCAWVGVYLAARIGWGPSSFSGYVWQLGVLVLGGIWWWHRRIRVAGRADRYARRWGKITRGETRSIELRALTGSKVVQALSLGSIAKLRIKLDEGITSSQVTRCCDALASYMPKMRPNSVFATPDEASARHLWFTFIPADPWKGKIPHPAPEPGSGTLRGLGFRFPMGILADANELVYKLAHTLLVGQSGSGKSIWLHALMRWLVVFTDVVIVGIDMAGGATLGVWRKVLALPLATDVEQAVHVLECLLGVVEVRERSLAAQSQDDGDDDEFVPSPGTPWIVVVIDEFPDLIAAGGDEVIRLVGRIGKRARKCGIRLVLAAQNGSKADTGSKEFQAQLRAVVGLGLDPHASKVLWGELLRQGWNSTGLKDGQFLLRDEDHRVPEIAKGYYTSPKDRRAAVAAAVAAGRPMCEPDAWDALMGTSGPMIIDVPVEAEEELDVVLRTLKVEGPHKADDLCALPGMPARATVFRWLKRAQQRGQAESVDGVWRFIPVGERDNPAA